MWLTVVVSPKMKCGSPDLKTGALCAQHDTGAREAGLRRSTAREHMYSYLEQELIIGRGPISTKLSMDSSMNAEESDDQRGVETASFEEHAENVAAVHSSIRDYLAGERGTLAGEHSAMLRRP
jgi:hypothetical protein